ncbi:hypothetical protein B0G62_102154 [Paraburkholderia eburnea]|uniref:Uncharacterized protein n=1 Tax=Paraburkholderia eburnea TaxID=1189126 RepID=A0A2S4MIF7_9BURK|nr:hypothetical protein [Paraburkholderia eburnea]POR54546.1 hypothetical protein B0G62_102154 [Paraburkholderia eburnea]PRZ19761.1 hypothetical protein BX588_114154 [Paraburkholderia eburnea]
MALTFEQDVSATLAAHQVALATALSIAAKQHPNPVQEIESRLPALLNAGKETYSNQEELERFSREVRAILMRATMHLTDDRQAE